MEKPINARQVFLAMNTVASIAAFGGKADHALAAAKAETDRLESLLSRFLPGSDISRLNRAAGLNAVPLHRETFEVLSSALEYAQNTDGCFDCTVGSLVALWNGTTVPLQSQVIDAARQLTGSDTLLLRRRGRTARLSQVGQSIDLGGIGKGYATDRMINTLHRYGIRSAWVDFGGNVAVLGAKPDGSPWTIGVRHPTKKNGLIGALTTEDVSVVTSGDDQRAVPTADATVRSHIIDPRTGLPVETGLLSVTVVSQSSTVADALATALFTAGIQQGSRILKRYPGTHAVYVNKDASVFITNGLRERFRGAQGIPITII